MSQTLYVIGPQNGPFKVGISSSVQSRLASIQTGYPHPLHIWATSAADNAKNSEQQMHAKLEPFRLVGEWFNANLTTIYSEMRSIGLSPAIQRTVEPQGTPTHSPAAIRSWVDEMGKPPFYADKARCAELLGVSITSLEIMSSEGMDRRTALACRALLHRFQPYGQ